MNSRALAVLVLTDVTQKGKSLTVTLKQRLNNVTDTKALVSELSYGVLRWHYRLVAILNSLLKKPFKEKDSDIKNLALVGLYQLIYMRVPDHAAIYETVSAVKDLKKTWAKSVVNGVLRAYQRDSTAINAKIDSNPVARYSHPAWLLDKLKEYWPQDWNRVVQENNLQAPMVLRVNCLKSTVPEYLKRLAHADISATATSELASGLKLEKAVDVEKLPGFASGYVSVQDAAAQLAANILDAQEGQRVLDVCAAPGGKTAHILEVSPKLDELIAIDIDQQRLSKVIQNLDRLALKATILKGDALQPGEWWDNEPFDRILLDAPCSATGVIRRHPDIKFLRQEQDVVQLVAIQAKMLDYVWALLKSGGKLLYATCSILKEENEHQVKAFMRRHSDVEHQNINEAHWGRECEYGRQILPGENDMDGFYYAVLVKK